MKSKETLQEKEGFGTVWSKKDVILLVGSILAVLVIGYYSYVIGSRTIINYWLLIKISLISGFIFFVILGLFKLIYWEDFGIVFWQYALASFISGTVFIFANSFSINPNYEYVSFPLKEKHLYEGRNGRIHPIASITYNDHAKDIWFKRYQKDQFQLADSVMVQVRKGNLGYGLVKDKFSFILNKE